VEGQQVERQKIKLVKIDRVKEWKVEKILNKIKIRGVIKYLVQWKRFIAENNTWKRKDDLENTREIVKFKRRMSIEVR